MTAKAAKTSSHATSWSSMNALYRSRSRREDRATGRVRGDLSLLAGDPVLVPVMVRVGVVQRLRPVEIRHRGAARMVVCVRSTDAVLVHLVEGGAVRVVLRSQGRRG